MTDTLAQNAQRYIDTQNNKYQFKPSKEVKYHKSITTYANYLNGNISFDEMAEKVTDDMRWNLPFMNEIELTNFLGEDLAKIVLNDDQVNVVKVG